MNNAKVLISLLIPPLLFFSSKTSAFAGDVVINEFLVDPDAQQWVELYNKGTGIIDISGWFIDDSGGTQKFTIPNNTFINAGELKVFESSSFNLNRTSPDIIRLLNGSTGEDSYSYDTGPGTDKSYGRETDGVGNWVVFNAPTKGSTNNTSTPAPTLTPTPTAVPTPSKIPTSTNTPTPTKIPTPTKTPTPTKAPTSTPIPTSTKTPTPTIKSSSTVAPTNFVVQTSEQPIPTSILGESTESAAKIEISPSAKETKVIGSSSSNLSKILIAIGAIFLISCGILAFRGYIKNRKESNYSG